MQDDSHPQYTSSPDQWDKLKPLARQMRRAPTETEELLWQRLRNRRLGGVKFRRQHTVSGFIVDFICIEKRLIIEVDGAVHDQPDQRDYDIERQRFLEEQGFRVLRFANEEVLESLDRVIREIATALATNE